MTKLDTREAEQFLLSSIDTSVHQFNHVAQVAVTEIYYMILERIRQADDPEVMIEVQVLFKAAERLIERVGKMEGVEREN